MNKITKPLLILGSGGHAKVLIDCLHCYKCTIIGLTDSDYRKHNTVLAGIKVIGYDDEVMKYNPDNILLINSLGSINTIGKRKQLFQYFKDKGYIFSQVIHNSAVISLDVELGEGLQIMAGSVIQPGCILGDNTIVNTKASLDHDCIIGNNVHIASGVTLSGNVRVGHDVHVGSGATVLQGVRIGDGSVIGAGSLVLKNVPSNVTVLGVPAKVV